jgi:hypothetical protein
MLKFLSRLARNFILMQLGKSSTGCWRSQKLGTVTIPRPT